MLERCKPYKVALSVRAIAPFTTHAALLASCTQDAWHALEISVENLTDVVGEHYRRCRRHPFVVVTLATENQGFGYGYFDTAAADGAGFVVGGHTPLTFDAPLPITPPPHHCVMAGLCGMVVARYTLRSIVLQVHEAAKRGGVVPPRAGWEFPSSELMGLHESASPKGFDVLTLSEFNPQDN